VGNRLCTENDHERKIPKTEVEVNDKRGNHREEAKKGEERRSLSCVLHRENKLGG
jgi:hypothetical protein